MTNSSRTALITGIGGQDGWYLARRLLELGYSITGTTHQSPPADTLSVDGRSIALVRLDLARASEVNELIRNSRPDEIYNLAARASSAQLFDDPLATADINGVAVARLLEAIRRYSPRSRFCQASSSEVFAGADRSPQNETTPRLPLNAYGAAKAFADHLVAAFRSTYGVFACSAILYPHESPRRPLHFLVRKVAHAAAQISLGHATQLVLGDLSAARDWGYAPDYAEAMRRMLNTPEPQDYVIATGESHRVQDVCEIAFRCLGLEWRKHVIVNDELKRPAEQVARVGNAIRARTELDWRPSLSFEQLITAMVETERLASSCHSP